MRNYIQKSAAIVLGLAGISGIAYAQADRSTGEESAADGPRLLEEVIVTARRRAEQMQDVPIAVSAITGEQAERMGIGATDALAMATPSLDYSRQGGFAFLPFLRGVGTSGAGAGFESPIAIYVDDVYIMSPNARLFDLNNVESVQVLKGPQGTLFGRNATGGVIQLRTKQPEFDPSARVTVGYGDYGTVYGSVYATGGLSDNVAVNFAASASDQSEGFGNSVLTGVDTQMSRDWNLRFQLLANLGDATSMKLSVDYSDYKTDMGWNLGILPGSTGIGGTSFSGEFNTATAGTDFSKIKQGGVALDFNHETSFADFVSISAYRQTDMQTLLDQDAGPIPFFTLDLDSPTNTFSQEFRLVSNSSDALQWVAGFYYLYATAEYDPALLTGIFFDPLAMGDPTGIYTFNDKQTLNSYSGFAEGTYNFTEDTSITVGIRYTEDSYEFDVDSQSVGSATIPVTAVPALAYNAEEDFGEATYRVILDHDFTPDILGYASYSHGFKSGGFNVAEPGFTGGQLPIRPESLDAYEFGLKTTLFGNLTFNMAAFYYDYEDLAVSITRANSLFIVNAAAAEINGFDADFVWTPMSGLQVLGGFGFLDGEYTNFPDGPVYTPNPNFPFGNSVGAADLAGKETQRTPDLTFNIAPSYTFRAGGGEVTLAASYYHNSGFFSDPENRLEQPSYTLINASVSYDWDNGLGLQVWSKNVTDDRYFAFLQADVFKDPASYGFPRTYGLTLRKEFQ